ncbi:MAG: hypothetical protein WCG27_03310, partial [Pseudomonadota bacterium]
MINRVKLINLPNNANFSFGDFKAGEVFILRTCQRLLLLSLAPIDGDTETSPFAPNAKTFLPEMEHYAGPEAYRYLLEVICGLRSLLLGEQEITGQFRQAFQDFLATPNRCSELILILEKLLKDSKEIRHRYLQNVGQQSYASITRYLLNKKAPHQGILLLGTGPLAQDMIKILKKRHQIHLSARNEEKTNALCQAHSLVKIPWDDHKRAVQFPSIINTIGADNTTLFPEEFFDEWEKGPLSPRIFIDLGSPSVIKTQKKQSDGVYRLEDIFQEGAQLNQEKQAQVARARVAIREIMQARAVNLSMSYFSAKISANSQSILA